MLIILEHFAICSDILYLPLLKRTGRQYRPLAEDLSLNQ